MNTQLTAKIKISADINVKTGLHIGGDKDNVEIGGVDSPVIKLAFKHNIPYIPGSSIRGKMRCLLEQTRGATEVGQNDDVNKFFGYSKKKANSKLIVRDAYLTEESKNDLEDCDELEMPFTEVKFENTIDRLRATSNPRQIERVPAGTVFHAEFIINVWDGDNEKELMSMLKDGLTLLENDYLGGSGSRGYGQIYFSNFIISYADESSKWCMSDYKGENIFNHD